MTGVYCDHLIIQVHLRLGEQTKAASQLITQSSRHKS